MEADTDWERCGTWASRNSRMAVSRSLLLRNTPMMLDRIACMPD